MHPTKILTLTALAVALTVTVSADTTLSQGTTVSPDESNATYVMGQNITFSSLTVYKDRVNFSSTNVSTTGEPANITIWKHNFSQTGEELALYHYNASSETSFHRINSSENYEVLFNGSSQRDINNQKYINVSVPENTNLTIQRYENSAPDAPSNPSPQNSQEGVSASPTLSVDVSDPDGDSMDVEFYDASDNSLIDTDSTSSGSTASVTWNNLNNGQTYSWYAVADDGQETNQSSTWSFTTNYPPELVSDSQFYTNFTVNHEFEVEAYANDTDGENDFQECKIYYEEPDGASGLLDGNIDTSYGDSEEVKCVKNLSSSINGIEVGEEVTTSTRFYDGHTWVNTSQESNTVPNNPPTQPTDFTDLGSFETTTPEVQWSGEDDPDGDSMTLQSFTGQSSDPSTLDNEKDSTASSINLGSSVTLERNKTYYYRLRVCDEYSACSSYTSSKEFRTNDKPDIKSYGLNNSGPSEGDSLKLEAEVDDRNLESVNFTVWKGNTLLVDSENGTLESGTWKSTEFTADEREIYNYTVKATDNVSETTEVQDNFTLGYRERGEYTETYTTSKEVRDVKIELYGDLNGQSIETKVNTSSSSTVSLENATWTDVTSGENVTLKLIFTGNSTQTPVIQGYNLSYRTDYTGPGYMKSQIKDFKEEVEVREVETVEKQPSETNLTYEYRTGSDSNPPTSWTDWQLCLDTCKPELQQNRYFQYRVNISGTSEKTGVLESIEVKYE